MQKKVFQKVQIVTRIIYYPGSKTMEGATMTGVWGWGERGCSRVREKGGVGGIERGREKGGVGCGKEHFFLEFRKPKRRRTPSIRQKIHKLEEHCKVT